MPARLVDRSPHLRESEAHPQRLSHRGHSLASPSLPLTALHAGESRRDGVHSHDRAGDLHARPDAHLPLWNLPRVLAAELREGRHADPRRAAVPSLPRDAGAHRSAERVPGRQRRAHRSSQSAAEREEHGGTRRAGSEVLVPPLLPARLLDRPAGTRGSERVLQRVQCGPRRDQRSDLEPSDARAHAELHRRPSARVLRGDRRGLLGGVEIRASAADQLREHRQQAVHSPRVLGDVPQAGVQRPAHRGPSPVLPRPDRQSEHAMVHADANEGRHRRDGALRHPHDPPVPAQGAADQEGGQPGGQERVRHHGAVSQLRPQLRVQPADRGRRPRRARGGAVPRLVRQAVHDQRAQLRRLGRLRVLQLPDRAIPAQRPPRAPPARPPQVADPLQDAELREADRQRGGRASLRRARSLPDPHPHALVVRRAQLSRAQRRGLQDRHGDPRGLPPPRASPRHLRQFRLPDLLPAGLDLPRRALRAGQAAHPAHRALPAAAHRRGQRRDGPQQGAGGADAARDARASSCGWCGATTCARRF